MKYNRNFFSNNILIPITSNIKKYTIIGFDTETHGYKNKLVIAGIYNDKYYKFFEKLEVINYMLNNSNKNIYYVATNLGFDYQAIFYNTEYWNKTKLIMRNGQTLSVKLNKLKMIDTINFSHSSVENLGASINLKKIEYKKYLGLIPKTKNQWKRLIEYNSRDCLISKRWIEIFQDIINSEVFGCELKTTISSTALDLFRRRFLKYPIYKEPFDCKEFIYLGYYGGRVECFKRGYISPRWFKELYWYDYNSAYPFQMLKNFPLPSSGKFSKTPNIKLIKKYHGTSEVLVECPYMKYPLLPFRQEDKLIFPYGKFRGIYNHIELKRALELGYKILKIYKTLYYTKIFYPFKQYALYLYNLRLKYKKENNEIMQEICKLLMNSLYGKFATKNMQDIEFFDMDNMTEKEIIIKDKKGIFDNMQPTLIKNKIIKRGYKETDKECNQNYILPILSSCVTSYQRVDLHKDLVKLNGIYCDTDSILSEKIQKDNFNLGGLKIEKKVSRGWLIRPKCYMIYDKTLDKKGKEKGWNIKVKGLNKMTSQKFYDILSKKAIGQIKFMKIKEAMKRNYEPNQKKKFSKIQILEDNKRVWFNKFDKTKLQDSEPIYINETSLDKPPKHL